ncbi:MAG: sugar phosphate nucleotidyltransferase [Holophagae bacterium]|jgi:mannose-1-phosphate guanylyltransferase
MGTTEHLWSIVLAGGDGRRLSHLTGEVHGRPVPKQYCSVRGTMSLLQQALRRGHAIAGPERTMVVVSAEHRCWWTTELIDLPPENTVVQPCNRGTACGLMLPLLQVLIRDPEATVVALPSDHVVSDEATLREAISTAAAHARQNPTQLVLLGIGADRPDTGLGWIEPSPGDPHPVRPVSQFVEKPTRAQAESLLRNGALWNSFIFAMSAHGLYALFEETLPWMTRMFIYTLVHESGGSPPERVARLYDRLPSVDFSRAILQDAGWNMSVVPVPPCGWTDVGTPEGVARCIASGPTRPRVSSGPATATSRPPVDLAEVLVEGRGRDTEST